MRQASSMKGKAVLVTGAAAGLGRATARRCAELGADVALVDIDAEGLARVAEEVQALGVAALVQAADLAEAGNCAAVIEAAVARFGRLDALCNVAAIMLPCHSTDMSPEAFQKTLAVNLSAPFFLIQAAIPHLLAVNGAVVNVASAVGIVAQAYTAAYCASKAGLIHLTKSLAMEYMHKPIRFNAVAPGGMMTALAGGMRALENADRSLLARCSPLRGLVEIDDVAEMVVFLASDAARGYHGSCVVIDAGLSAG
jgi:NAD(P)-dependent dehydrogenase (short-subunit alcohol dehydrogenase family)